MDNTSATKIANFEYFDEEFPTEKAALEYWEKIKWNGHPVCPKCSSLKVSKWRDDRPGWYRCKKCRKEFTARHDTIFACTKIPLRTWFKAWYNMVQHGGISMRLAEDIGVVQETAWFMTHRIREAMRTHKENMMLGGPGIIVEIDETYPGGLGKIQALR